MPNAICPGPRNLITDVPGLRVGHAQSAQLKSGTTVLVGDAPFCASVHVMGGAPGTRDTDLLAPDKTVEQVDALVLSGGSAFGLDACSGVSEGLREIGRGFAIGPALVPIVPGAIIFDLLNGGHKDWLENPYRALGRAALDAAGNRFELGTAGAGTGAMAARQKGGIGSASTVMPDGHTVGALVAVNALGSVTTPGDRHFWAAPFEMNGEFGGLGPDPNGGYVMPDLSLKEEAMKRAAGAPTASDDLQNTTISIVATDMPLSKTQCYRLSVMAHDGMARAIVPSHTPMDGDLVFGVSTGDTAKACSDQAQIATLGAFAANTLARAIARAVYHARPAANDLIPCYHR